MKTPKAKCENCGKMTDISESTVYKQMKVKCQVATEELKSSEESRKKVRRQRAGDMNAMHICIKRLYELMTKEQKEKAAKISQQLRGEIKKIEKTT